MQGDTNYGQSAVYSQHCSLQSRTWPQAALLFNLGATATQDALLFDTKNDAGMKAAARRFQVCTCLD